MDRTIPPRVRRGRRALLPILAVLPLLANGLAAAPEPPRATVLRDEALRLADARFDPRAALVWGNPRPERRVTHATRLSAWYAVGLLDRNAPGDRERAVAVLEAVLRQQARAPGTTWDGTFFRSPQEPRPPDTARRWDDYDPNWRQFIGCAFAQILLDHGDELPAGLRAKLEDSIRRAVEGELHENRLRPGYTNIALMHGFLQGFAGARLGRRDWIDAAEQWLDAVHAEFTPHGTFEEYNSPTYYGVNLYALALLRRHGATDRLRELGGAMEFALWRDIAGFYHAGLRNLCGPYDRSYGMDLTKYVSLLGVWLALELPREAVPLPPIAPVMSHGNDFLFAPLFVSLGTRLPPEVREHLLDFSGERQLERPIADGMRIATAWLEDKLMIGAEATGFSRHVRDANHQFKPATIHWRVPDGSIGWIALVASSRLDAQASRRQLMIEATGDCTIRVHAPGLKADGFKVNRWTLPGLEVAVEADARSWSVAPAGPDELDVTFVQPTRLVLQPRPLEP